ncbi:MAG: hypothetical protein QOF04_2323 [Solirubrobacteraceae bacterium]|nr:hypothetical protein [Solirubrobacteraceae bacterium]
MRRPPPAVQMLGSLLVALAIVLVVVAVVSARLGPGGGVDAEDRAKKLEQQREDVLKEREKRLKDRRDDG